jgi:hypothetical protein
MLSKTDIDEFVTKHADTSFVWGKETVPPEKLASFLAKIGILPCIDCKRFFATLEGALTHPIVRVNNGECECGRVCSVQEWNEEMLHPGRLRNQS